VNGAERISAERRRQVEVEGYDHEHDLHRGHTMPDGMPPLTAAAIAYATPSALRDLTNGVPVRWPWEAEAWKPTHDRVRELEKAGALIAAEIDRLLAQEVT
jgi:hypothetical protein